MKHLIKFFLSFILFVWFGISSYGQTTNSFPPSGNVGIGTTTPSYKLQVVQDGWKAMFSGSDGYIEIGTNTNFGMIYTDRGKILFNQIITAHDGLFGAYNTSAFQFNTGVTFNSIGTTRMTIANNGNVGIGTTNPTVKLAVNGKIHCVEIKVEPDISVPDYVFNKDYKLWSLNEVADYIQKNKHLPEVPSAAEFKKNGLAVGNMDYMLLRKVEELTLYIIKQQKMIDKQSKRIDQLEESVGNDNNK